MNRPVAQRHLRDRLDELEVYVTRIAERTNIPAAHLEKDFWVTEVLIWPDAPKSTFEECCSLVHKLRDKL